MAEVAFYHLTMPLERTLPRLLERALEQGRKVAIRSSDAGRLKALDEMLWTHDDASFLPHGRDGEFAERQPVLLTEAETPANGADVLIVFEAPVPAFEGRVIYMFDAATVADGRAAWRELEARDGVERTYWQQDERGRWAKKA